MNPALSRVSGFLLTLLAGSSALVPEAFAKANAPVLIFDGADYVNGPEGVQFSRLPEPPRSSMRGLMAFGPAARSIGYTGPEFHVGYEVRASGPSNLVVPSAAHLVENDIQNGDGKRNDTLSITGVANWSASQRYSVAAVIFFPTQPFALHRLAYSASNWTKNKSYNDRLRHRWVVRTGGKYYVNAAFLGRTGRRSESEPLDVIESIRSLGLSDRWIEYDPASGIVANLETPAKSLGRALDDVSGVGLYVDSLEFEGSGSLDRQWQLKLLVFQADGFPASP